MLASGQSRPLSIASFKATWVCWWEETPFVTVKSMSRTFASNVRC
ncbi:MAG TPA: hypothetical protein VM347_34790 [Nonomuraea sp.]|nr:hypothetical protein [Nonomuraea sp.]